MGEVKLVESRVLQDNFGRCERCNFKRATYRIETEGEQEDVCGYHYGEAKGYVAKNNSAPDENVDGGAE